MLPKFIITYQIIGIKYGAAEVEEASSRITESERWRRIHILRFCTTGAQVTATQNALCSVLPCKSCGCYVPLVSLKGRSSDH